MEGCEGEIKPIGAEGGKGDTRHGGKRGFLENVLECRDKNQIEKQNHPEKRKINSGVLGDIAPTILDLIDVKQPKEMTQKSLIIKS